MGTDPEDTGNKGKTPDPVKRQAKFDVETSPRMEDWTRPHSKWAGS